MVYQRQPRFNPACRCSGVGLHSFCRIFSAFHNCPGPVLPDTVEFCSNFCGNHQNAHPLAASRTITAISMNIIDSHNSSLLIIINQV
jgi:hypothetical protein